MIYLGPAEFCRLCLRADLVHDMTKFMEKGLHFAVIQQGRFALRGLGKVGQHGTNVSLPFTSLNIDASGLEWHDASVTVFALTGMQIQVEVTHQITTLGVHDTIL